MGKKLECTQYDPKLKQNKVVGFMEFRNEVAEKAELYLYGDIVRDQWYKWSDDDTCPQDIADFLKDIDKYQNLDIYINSGGGSVHGGLAIYHQLKRHTGFKTVHVDGIAASISSVIACVGDKIVVPGPAQFMVHKPSICLWASVNANDLRKEADTLDVCEESILSIYMENVKEGVTREQIEKLVNEETWLTGETITDYFNFEVEEAAEAVAYASNFYDKYKNTPINIRDSREINEIANNNGKPKMSDELRNLLNEVKTMEGYEDFDKKFI